MSEKPSLLDFIFDYYNDKDPIELAKVIALYKAEYGDFTEIEDFV